MKVLIPGVPACFVIGELILTVLPRQRSKRPCNSTGKRGIGDRPIDAENKAEKNEKNLAKGVAKMFKSFPPRSTKG